jgi:hypothetical protein
MSDNWLVGTDSFKACGSSIFKCVPNIIGNDKTYVIIMNNRDGVWIGEINFTYKDTNGKEQAHLPTIILKLTFSNDLPVVKFNTTWYKNTQNFVNITVNNSVATLEGNDPTTKHSSYIMLFKKTGDTNPTATLSKYFGHWINNMFTLNIQKAGAPPKWRSTGRKIKIDGKTRTLFSHPSHPEPRLRKMVQRGTKTIATYIKVKK